MVAYAVVCLVVNIIASGQVTVLNAHDRALTRPGLPGRQAILLPASWN
jgi:hypothetical protein